MTKRIVIIQGHPDQSPERFCRAIATAYTAGAEAAGHDVLTIDVAKLDFPPIRNKADFEHGAPPSDILDAQQSIKAADHIAIVFPLWLGDMPAHLKGFLEQVLRPGFAFSGNTERGQIQKLLKGKSAHVFVTMGMPALFYRLYFGAHGLKNLRRNILHFCGIKPVRETLIGMVEHMSSRSGKKWLTRAQAFGHEGV